MLTPIKNLKKYSWTPVNKNMYLQPQEIFEAHFNISKNYYFEECGKYQITFPKASEEQNTMLHAIFLILILP